MTGQVELFAAYAVLTFLVGYYVNHIRSRLTELDSRLSESSQHDEQ